jgi:phage baseplate assembly protein W
MTRDEPAALAFPFRFGPGGRSAVAPDLPSHVRDEVIQLLLTAIGERLFLRDFGTGIQRLVFDNVDAGVVGVTKATIAQALSRWLATRAQVDALEVTFSDGQLNVDLAYRVASDRNSRQMRFQRKLG